MDNNKMFTFMIVLAVTFIIMNLYFYYTKPAARQTQQQTANVDVSNDMFAQTAYGSTDTEQTSASEKDRWEIIGKDDAYNAEDLIYDNGKIHIEWTPYGGEIKQAVIINANKNVKANAQLIDQNETHGAFRMKLGSWADGKTIEELTNGDNYFNFTRNGDEFVFKCSLHDKVKDIIYTIVKTYTMVDDENIFRVKIDMSNEQNEENKFDQTNIAYSLGWGPSLNQSGDKFNKQYDHYAYYNGKKMQRVDMNSRIFRGSNIAGYAEKDKVSADRWFARNDRYFSVLILPDTQSYKYFFDYRGAKFNEFYGGFEHVTKKSQISAEYYVYMGPQLKSVIKKYDNYYKDDFNITDSAFSKSVRPILWGIGNLMGMFLNLLYKVVRNYGVAIILLTIIIKLLLAPLTHSSMKSQAKMTELQPRVKELQDKYKDNPNQLNQEMMNLYKKAGVNPMCGCLPMLLQMPILLAMYRLLDRMVELKGAQFLWISDLSRPDCVWQWPFTVPLLNISGLNILPIIMVATQVWSSLTMPGAKDNKQTQYMIWMMPLLFFFMFYNVSSGLVLYWTVMNILGIVQQEYMNRMQKNKPAVAGDGKPMQFVRRGKKNNPKKK